MASASASAVRQGAPRGSWAGLPASSEVDDDPAVVGDFVDVERAGLLPATALCRTRASRDRAEWRLRDQYVIEARARATVVAPPECRAGKAGRGPLQVGGSSERSEIGAIVIFGRIEVAEHHDALPGPLRIGGDASERLELAGANHAAFGGSDESGSRGRERSCRHSLVRAGLRRCRDRADRAGFRRARRSTRAARLLDRTGRRCGDADRRAAGRRRTSSSGRAGDVLRRRTGRDRDEPRLHGRSLL
jgi:hypothetical protein